MREQPKLATQEDDMKITLNIETNDPADLERRRMEEGESDE